MEIAEIRKNLPEYVLNTSDVLINHGYKAFLVGGAVKDMLLGVEPKDYDIATDALPEQISEIFPHSVSTNAKFGTILVINSDRKGERYDVEVTTFRSEEDYFGGRWPSKVEFADDITTDLSRRDFTINAMAIDLDNLNEQGSTHHEIIVDPFGGQTDLENKIIKAVGDPMERFGEDGLRAYRACRLAAILGFTIEEKTFEAIKASLNISKMVSMERVRDELLKLLKYAPQPSIGIELLRESGLLELFLPELLECINVEQPEWHTDDVYTHSLKTLDLAEDSIKLAALLHDIGKARTRSEDETGVHFYSHDTVGAEIVKVIMERLKFSNSEIKKVSTLVRWHMFYYPSAEWRKENPLEIITDQKSDSSGGWSDSAIRRFIANVGEEYIDNLFKLRIADANANPKSEFDPIEIQALQDRISEVRSKDMALKITDLNITGEDLFEAGIEKGPKMGEVLKFLLEKVIEDPILNDKEQLLSLSKDYLSNKA
jgi:poly(A) polymerase/tRNA nucleotidyltransferase (CCA-adding enzyme)